MVGEQQQLMDTTIMIILYSRFTFHVLIAEGYSEVEEVKQREEKKRKEKESKGAGEEVGWWVNYMDFKFIFPLDKVGEDRSP